MAQEEVLPQKGDLFVHDNEDSLTVTSIFNGKVSIRLRRMKDENRGHTKLQLRMDPDTRQFFVRHYRKCYILMRQDDPEYENRKPVDEVQEKPAEFDARDFLKVGDKLRWDANFSYFGTHYVTVTKVTRCFATYVKANGITNRGRVTPPGSCRIKIRDGNYAWYEKDLVKAQPKKDLVETPQFTSADLKTPPCDQLWFALTHTDHEGFMKFFIEKNKQVYENYFRLATANGSIDHFKANPLAFLISNQPACCYHIATEYIIKTRNARNAQ